MDMVQIAAALNATYAASAIVAVIVIGFYVFIKVHVIAAQIIGLLDKFK